MAAADPAFSADVLAPARAWHAGLAVRQGLAGPEAADALRGFDPAADPLVRARAEWFLAAGVIDLGNEALTGALLTGSLEAFTRAGTTGAKRPY